MKPLATMVIHSDCLCNIATATVLCVKLMELQKRTAQTVSLRQLTQNLFTAF